MKTYTEVEVAEDLKCSRAVLRKWRKLGQGPRFVKIGRMVRYPADAVEAFLLRHTVDGSASNVVVSKTADDRIVLQ